MWLEEEDKSDGELLPRGEKKSKREVPSLAMGYFPF
jgi:hypothetical protein